VGTSAGALMASCVGIKQFSLDRVKFLQDKMAADVIMINDDEFRFLAMES
jgi:hypothetical protein